MILESIVTKKTVEKPDSSHRHQANKEELNLTSPSECRCHGTEHRQISHAGAEFQEGLSNIRQS